MLIVIELDVTNDQDEIGVAMDSYPARALMEKAVDQIESFGLEAKDLIVTGIKTSVKAS